MPERRFEMCATNSTMDIDDTNRGDKVKLLSSTEQRFHKRYNVVAMDTVQDIFAAFGAMRHKLLLLYKNVANVVAVNMREISGVALLSIEFSTFSQL